MTAQYRNDLKRLSDRITLVLESLEGAPGVDQSILADASDYFDRAEDCLYTAVGLT